MIDSFIDPLKDSLFGKPTTFRLNEMHEKINELVGAFNHMYVAAVNPLIYHDTTPCLCTCEHLNCRYVHTLIDEPEHAHLHYSDLPCPNKDTAKE